MPSTTHPQYETGLAAGKARRENCPRTRQAECVLSPSRDVLAMLRQSSADRVPG
jgi:hypothetical protein